MRAPDVSYRIFFAFFVLATLLVVRPAFALNVTDMRAGVHADKTRIVLDLSTAPQYQVSLSSGKPQALSIILPKGKIPPTLDSSFAKLGLGPLQVTSQKNNKMRLSLSLTRSATIKTVFALPPKGKDPPRLVIDLAMRGALPSSPSTSGVLGQIIVRGAQPVAAVRAAVPASVVPVPNEEWDETPVRLNTRPLIILDPGHGGKDTGAIGAKGRREKDVTLAMARTLKASLEATGRYRVKLTRTTDVFIMLGDRVKFARQNKGDLFVSLHADSIDPGNSNRSRINGASIYTLSEKASDAQTAKLAERENKVDLIAGVNLAVENKEVADILLDLAMRETMNQSKYFANTIVQKLDADGVPVLERPHRFAGFAVLKAPDIPSVLIELGFMSNPREEAMLSSEPHRQRIARALVRGIDGYFAKLEQARRQ